MASWWETNAPEVPGYVAPSTSTSQSSGGDSGGSTNAYADLDALIQKWYQTYLGRSADQWELNSHHGNPNGLSDIENTIKSSPEAKAYSASSKSSGMTETGGITGASNRAKTFGEAQSIALAYAQSLGDPSDENLAKVADYMRSQGFDVEYTKGVDGMAINGIGVDMVQNYKGGGAQKWQWLPDYGDSGSSGGVNNNPYGGVFDYADYVPPPDFVAPDANSVLSDQGFQARLKQGTDALQRSAAAKGTLLTGGTLKGLQQFSQDYASNEYENAYNRAKGDYNTKYSNSLTDWTTNYGKAKDVYNSAYGQFETAQSNTFDRLYKIWTLGQTSAATTIPSGSA